MVAASAVDAMETAVGAGNPQVEALRAAMADVQHSSGTGIDAYIVPSEDAHMSEYAPDCDNRRAFISGFTGSAGTAVVATSKAALWTDGRYFLQAEQQLGSGWTLMKGGVPGTPEISDWLVGEVPEGGYVGIDPFLHTIAAARKLDAQLKVRWRVVEWPDCAWEAAAQWSARTTLHQGEGGARGLAKGGGGRGALNLGTYMPLVSQLSGNKLVIPPSGRPKGGSWCPSTLATLWMLFGVPLALHPRKGNWKSTRRSGQVPQSLRSCRSCKPRPQRPARTPSW